MWRACKTLAKDPWRRFGFHADLCRFHADLCRFDVDLRRGRGGARPNTINYHANAHIMWVLKTRYVKTHVVNMCFCNRARAHPHPVKCLSPMAHNMMRTLVSTPQHFTTLHNTSKLRLGSQPHRASRACTWCWRWTRGGGTAGSAPRCRHVEVQPEWGEATTQLGSQRPKAVMLGRQRTESVRRGQGQLAIPYSLLTTLTAGPCPCRKCRSAHTWVRHVQKKP